jgi:hypothetical protein
MKNLSIKINKYFVFNQDNYLLKQFLNEWLKN